MDKSLGLGDDGQGPVDEGGDAELRRNLTTTIPQYTLGGGTEHGDMIGQYGGHVLEEIRPLGEGVISVTVGQPSPVGGRRVHHFLQTKHLWLVVPQIGQEGIEQLSTPAIQGHDAHVVLLSAGSTQASGNDVWCLTMVTSTCWTCQPSRSASP